MKQNDTSAEFSTNQGGSWEGEGVPPQFASWGNIVPEKAIDYWKNKSPILEEEWLKLSDRERDRAFTAANIANINQLQKTYDVIEDCIKNGTTINKAKKELLSNVALTDAHAETILRTNIASAYSAGRYSEMTSALKYRPYWKYVSIDDDRTRLSHLALNGVVYPADDPFWTVNYPPNGYKCRCDVVSLSERQVKERGIEVAHTKNVPYVLNKAFARNPAEIYKPVLDKYCPQSRQKYIENAVDYAESDMVRLKKLLNQDDLALAQSIIETANYTNKEDVKNWIDKVLKNMQPKGEVTPMGNLPPKVTRFLKGIGSEPKLSLVTLSDERIAHMARDSKKEREAALTADEIKAIPEKFRSLSTRWFYDKGNDAVLMAFIRDGDDWLKVAIKTDRKVGKGIANEIITAGKIHKLNLEQEGFEKIK